MQTATENLADPLGCLANHSDALAEFGDEFVFAANNLDGELNCECMGH